MLVLKNANMLTMTDERIWKGDMAIQGTKIRAVADNIRVGDQDHVIDLAGKFLMPGLIDAHCHIGMWEDSLDFEGADGNETIDPVVPHLRAIDSINPYDRCFREAMESGVTTVMTGPGSADAIGGTFVAMKTVGRTVDEMIVREPAAMKIALGENPKRVSTELKRGAVTRMGTVALIREAMAKAQRYREAMERAQGDPSKMPTYDIKCEALLPVLRREIPLKTHCHRADDIITALRIADEFNVEITLDHVTDGARIADVLKERQVGLILGPLFGDRSKPELASLSMKNPAILSEKGLLFAIMSDHPVNPTSYLPVIAALAVREGLDAWVALRAITITAARILKIDDRVGSLEMGKDADLVIYDRNPLDIHSRVSQVYVNGKKTFDRISSNTP